MNKKQGYSGRYKTIIVDSFLSTIIRQDIYLQIIQNIVVDIVDIIIKYNVLIEKTKGKQLPYHFIII